MGTPMYTDENQGALPDQDSGDIKFISKCSSEAVQNLLKILEPELFLQEAFCRTLTNHAGFALSLLGFAAIKMGQDAMMNKVDDQTIQSVTSALAFAISDFAKQNQK